MTRTKADNFSKMPVPKINSDLDLNDLTDFEVQLFNTTFAASVAAINASRPIAQAQQMKIYFASNIQAALYFAHMTIKVHRDMIKDPEIEYN